MPIYSLDTNVADPTALAIVAWHPTGPTTARSQTSQVQTPTAGTNAQRIHAPL